MSELADKLRARRDELHQRLYAELDCDQVFRDGTHISVGLDAFLADALRIIADAPPKPGGIGEIRGMDGLWIYHGDLRILAGEVEAAHKSTEPNHDEGAE